MRGTHHCTDRCSHAVTDETLGALGFPVAKWDKVCGTPVLVTAGVSHGEAIYEAWKAGLVRICTKTEKVAA